MPAKTAAPAVDPITIEDWSHADKILLEIAKRESDLATEQAKQKQAVTDATEQYRPKIERLEAELKARVDGLGAFVLARPKEMDEGTKSRKLDHGTVSIRLGEPVLETVGKRTTWTSVVETIMGMGAMMRKKYLREKPQLNKEALTADIEAGKISADDQAKMGLTTRRYNAAFYVLRAD